MAISRISLLLAALSPLNVFADEVLTVAVASNFRSTATEITAEFKQRTKIPVRISSGSTGTLYAQIVNGAPFDVFLAADTERPELLVAAGLAASDSLAVYAIGQLVLWSNDPRLTDADCLGVFNAGEFEHLAIANPKTAPYGRAAIEYLSTTGLAGDFAGKLVLGENVVQAFQFVATGNTTFGLVARSQTLQPTVPKSTCSISVGGRDSSLLVSQAGLVLAAAKNQSAAFRFMEFMQSTFVCDLIARHGYRAAPNASCETG